MVLRYFGGKASLAAWILPQLPVCQNYYEPFLGGAAILQAVKRHPGWEMATDLNPRTVNFWVQLRDNPKDIYESIRHERWAEDMQLSRGKDGPELTEDAYALYRRWYEGKPNDAAQDAAWYYLASLYGFLGMGVGNNPNPSPSRASSSPNILALQRASLRLQGVDIRLGDALKGIKQCNAEGTLIYADPPYVHTSRRSTESRAKVKGKTPYRGYVSEMDDAAHLKLMQLLQKFSDRGGKVVLSGYGSDLYRDTLKGWTLTQKVIRSSNQKKKDVDGGEKPVEYLWACPNCVPAQRSLFVMG
jgi:DNA adenine methylase